MALFEYQKQVQRFIRDSDQVFINPDDIRNYVNRARRNIALRTQCVRIVSPVYGQVTTATITNAGSGYVNPVATISGPDFPGGTLINPNGAQATATVQQIGGVISNISITYGGDGYFQPTITISDSGGPGVNATATVAITPIMQTQGGQEVYNFSQIPVQNFPGVGQVYFANSVTIIYASFRYSLRVYSFSTYQALIRNYTRAYQYVPSIFAQVGRGTNGSLYCYPVASQPYQMEIDAFCLPIDLTDDESEEAIPQPWQDLIPHLAAHYAFLELQNLNSANYYLKLFDSQMNDYSSWAAPRQVTNRYGRY